MWKKLLDLLFPIRCAGCAKGTSILCAKCLTNIPRPINELFDIQAPLSYQDKTVAKAIWKLKYGQSSATGELLGDILGEFVLDDLSEMILLDTSNYIIVPVPLSRKRIQMRGYNQALILAMGVSRKTGISINANLVVKTKETTPQVSLKSRKERLRNLRGAFAINEAYQVPGKFFIVIDDVHTTGTTIREISNLLFDYGAKNVQGYTLAH